MPTFSKHSEDNLNTAHSDLQKIARMVIQIVDFSVICGLRDEIAQQQAVTADPPRSWVNYPNSRHNRSKRSNGEYDYSTSDAIDCVPYPIKWPDIRKQTTMEYVKRMGRFYFMAGVFMACAFILGVKIRWGGDFKNKFDGPHFERVVD